MTPELPSACTLPTADVPLRLAEFDALFATALVAQWRLSPTVLRWHLDPAAEAVARDLTRRENECCAFFAFAYTRTGRALQLDIEVPDRHTEILNTLATRAADVGRL